MRLGLSTYAFTWAFGVPGYPIKKRLKAVNLLEKAAEWDLACVQFADNLPLHRLSRQEQAQIKKYAAELKIAIEIGTRGLQPDNIAVYLDLAERFESPILRVVIDDEDYKPEMSEIIQTLKKLAPILEKRQVSLAIENHDRFKAQEFLHILEAVPSPRIGICLDSVNSMGAGEGVYWVTELLGPYTINFHVKEFTIARMDHKMGFKIEGRPAGQGLLPLRWMLAKIGKSCASAILEQWVPPEPDIQATIAKEEEWAKASVQYLKLFFSE